MADPEIASRLGSAFRRRAARAEELAAELPGAARAPLEFAAGLLSVQGAVATAIATPGMRAAPPLRGRLEDDLGGFVGELEAVLRFAIEHGPPALSEAAAQRIGEDPRARLLAFWSDGASGRSDYLCRALLRPYAEALAAFGLGPDRTAAAGGGCPFCGGAPWIAWRASAADGDGAQRFLGCAFCGSAWPLGRICCPACGEGDPDKLAAFQSDRHPAARLETCATCHAYVKSIDLTVGAHAIPEVDDLVSLSMDLWAADQGYTRLEPGLAGL
jgi:FdhE protein